MSPGRQGISQVFESHQHSSLERLNVWRYVIPVFPRLDYAIPNQSVSAEGNGQLHRQLQEFGRKLGCPVRLKTAFIGRNDSIVCTAEAAWASF